MVAWRWSIGLLLALGTVLISPAVVDAVAVTPVDPGVSSEVSIEPDCAPGQSLLVVVPAGALDVRDSLEFPADASPAVYDFARLDDLVDLADAALAVSCVDADGVVTRTECFSVIFQPMGAVSFVETRSCGGLATEPIVHTFEVTPVDPGVSSEVSIAAGCGVDQSVLVVVPVGSGMDTVVFAPGESPVAYDFSRLGPLDDRADAVLAASCVAVGGAVSNGECFSAIFQPLGAVGLVERRSCDSIATSPPIGRSVVAPVAPGASSEVRIWSNCAAGDVTALDVLTLPQDAVLDSVVFPAGQAVVTYDFGPLDPGSDEALLAVECLAPDESLASCSGWILDFLPAGLVAEHVEPTGDCRAAVAAAKAPPTTAPPTTVSSVPTGDPLPATGAQDGVITLVALVALVAVGLGGAAAVLVRRPEEREHIS